MCYPTIRASVTKSYTVHVVSGEAGAQAPVIAFISVTSQTNALASPKAQERALKREAVEIVVGRERKQCFVGIAELNVFSSIRIGFEMCE